MDAIQTRELQQQKEISKESFRESVNEFRKLFFDRLVTKGNSILTLSREEQRTQHEMLKFLNSCADTFHLTEAEVAKLLLHELIEEREQEEKGCPCESCKERRRKR